jgi:hypothetical protein
LLSRVVSSSSPPPPHAAFCLTYNSIFRSPSLLSVSIVSGVRSASVHSSIPAFARLFDGAGKGGTEWMEREKRMKMKMNDYRRKRETLYTPATWPRRRRRRQLHCLDIARDVSTSLIMSRCRLTCLTPQRQGQSRHPQENNILSRHSPEHVNETNGVEATYAGVNTCVNTPPGLVPLKNRHRIYQRNPP